MCLRALAPEKLTGGVMSAQWPRTGVMLRWRKAEWRVSASVSPTKGNEGAKRAGDALVGKQRVVREDVPGVGVGADDDLLGPDHALGMAVGLPPTADRGLAELLDGRPREEGEGRRGRREREPDELRCELVRVDRARLTDLSANGVLDARDL